MKNIPNSLIVTTLLFCFLSTIFHTSFHFHYHQEDKNKHSPCSQENGEQKFSEDCDECLNKDEKSHDSYFPEIGHFTFFNTYDYGFENYIKYSFPLNLHCRPPPGATT